MGPRAIRAYCKPSDEVKGLLRAAIQQLGLSARAYDRLLKVSRTIADLEGVKDIQKYMQVYLSHLLFVSRQVFECQQETRHW